MSQELQARYKGFCSTNLLWKRNIVLDIDQFTIPDNYSATFQRKLERRIRLGQLAEQFVFNQIETCDHTELLAENIQIQKDKNTLGELDTLLMLDDKAIHLEIVYKFYVYDATLGTSEIECWIGPNRKDSLIEKLTKLKEKQFPLLYSSECNGTLSRLKLEHLDYEQSVLFKAQLFVPYQNHIAFSQLNSDCVQGFYIHTEQLSQFKACEFFIPEKLDWFLNPHHEVSWMNYENFRRCSSVFLKRKQCPLFWLKDDTNLKKAFLVWW